ncbi:MAG: NAD(+)/NADH kinase [Gemmatimonadales bacterium]
MNVGVVGNPRYGDLESVLRQLAREAPGRRMALFTEPSLVTLWENPVPLLDEAPLNVLITFGGDGTLLRGARMLHGREVPILGVNLGRVGFLTTATRDGLTAALDTLQGANYLLERRLALTAAIESEAGDVRSEQQALNDIAIHKAGVARVIRVRVLIEGEDLGPFSADGIIVSSPTGSTAYSLSAGGPIVAPDVEAMVITPVCAHTLAVRPLVVPAGYTISIEPLAPGGDDLLISYDGQVGASLAAGDKVLVRRAAGMVQLIRLGHEGYFSRMRQKLHWGDLADREVIR